MNDLNDDFVLKKCFISLGIPNDFVNLRFSNEIQKSDFDVIFGTKWNSKIWLWGQMKFKNIISSKKPEVFASVGGLFFHSRRAPGKRWNEMKWNEMKWMKWNEMKWNEMKWNEMKWNEMKWNEMKWMKWMHY